jgi:hypothetical protein
VQCRCQSDTSILPSYFGDGAHLDWLPDEPRASR